MHGGDDGAAITLIWDRGDNYTLPGHMACLQHKGLGHEESVPSAANPEGHQVKPSLAVSPGC